MAVQLDQAQLQLLCHESRQSSVLAMQWFFTLTAVVIVSLRLYCRTKVRKGLGWDDYTIVAGAILGFPSPIFITNAVRMGLGKHIECLGPVSTYATIHWIIAAEAHHIVCLGRIATFLWANIALVAAIHVAQLAMLLAECRPLSALWDPKVHGKCYSPKTTYTTTYIAFSLDAFTDLVCSGIPIFVIYRMQMNARTKVELCILMGLGVFTAMCAVAKAITLEGIWSRDFTWNEAIVVEWASAEQALSLILASLPILRPFFRSFFTTTKSVRSPAEAPKMSSRNHRRALPNRLWFKITDNRDTICEGDDTLCAFIQPEDATKKSLQIPLTAYRAQWAVESNVRADHDGFEERQ